MNRGGQSQNPDVYSLAPIRIKAEGYKEEPGDQAAFREIKRGPAHDQAGRITLTAG